MIFYGKGISTVDMLKLLYVGKTNKNFTCNKIYNYSYYYVIHIIVETDNKNKIKFCNNPTNRKRKFIKEKTLSYFLNNFKFLNCEEYNTYLRKIKILKLDSYEL